MLVFILINIIVGIVVVDGYGESYDEANNKIYGRQSRKAFSWWFNQEFELEKYLGPTNQRYRGASYPLLATLLVDFLKQIYTRWLAIDLWHLLSFLTFQLSVWFLFQICKSFISAWASLGAAMLFSTQPLLWGHAFINSKDIPFMAFFLMSIALGLKMVDDFSIKVDLNKTWKSTLITKSWKKLTSSISEDWSTASDFSRWIISSTSLLLLLLIIIRRHMHKWIAVLISGIYNADPSSTIGKMFQKLAENKDKLPVELYQQKAAALYQKFDLITCIFLCLFVIVTNFFIFRITWAWIKLQITNSWPTIKKYHIIFVSGAVWGLCISIRFIGLFAGGIVGLYFVLKARKKSIFVLCIYVIIAFLVMYLTWPYLWQAPLDHFFESIKVASNFPWAGDVLFNGERYPENDLPGNYLPLLMAIQFTEPAIFLLLISLLLVLVKSFQGAIKIEKWILISIWFFVPLILVVFIQPVMYDNFRHFLFIIPPLFVFMGIVLDSIYKWIKHKCVFVVILAVLLFPGVYQNITLHPYQYIYYNQFVGGVSGAFHRFEMDYWVTSYRDATLYLNKKAPLESKVLVVGPRRIFMRYAREDLNQGWFTAEKIETTDKPVYVIVSTRYKYKKVFPEAEIVHEITTDGAVLSVVKRIQ